MRTLTSSLLIVTLLLFGCTSDDSSATDTVSSSLPEDVATDGGGDGTDVVEPSDPGTEPADPGTEPADPGTEPAGCGPPPPGVYCCCDMDAVTDIVCQAEAWTCPANFNWFFGTECTDICGPCSLPCDDQDAGQTDPGHDAFTLQYSRSGGFAGMLLEINIDALGQLTSGTCIQQLSGTQITDLVAVVSGVDWVAVAASYKKPDNPFCCCDQFVYTLAASVGVADSYSTDWCDDALLDGDVPEPLTELTGALETLTTEGCSP
ncbi:MAG: hypothetical protein ACI9WU_004976 [Myxococcota bacterium]|jgi:hypothetical protein